jgi:hypothetical protein
MIAGGALNFLFGVFHVWLGWNIYRAQGLSAGSRGLMLALDVGGTLLIFFLAYASVFCARELLTTRIGRGVLVLAAVLYLSRAAEEFVWFSFTPAIFFSCLLAGLIYAVLWFTPSASERVATTGAGH